MIRIKRDDGPWEVVTPTIFPDGTSQVWQLKTPLDSLVQINGTSYSYTVKWNFENEAELIHLIQLSTLINRKENFKIYLDVPYFPYARQDKEVTNTTTFALNPIFQLLNSYFYSIYTYDVHNVKAFGETWGLVNRKPDHINKAIEASNPDLIFYPDQGAFKRYSEMFAGEKSRLNMLSKGYGEKVRDQKTGAITSYNAVLPADYPGDTVLIVDDLIDGGATFIKAAEKLKSEGAKNVDLCVSHTVNRKGLENVLANGIRHVYTTNSRNIEVPNNVTVFEV